MTSESRSFIVTGAGGAMGSAAVARLAARSANVLCVDLDVGNVSRVLDGIDDFTGDLVPLGADVSQESDVVRCMATAVERWGGIDGIFNIAAVLEEPRSIVNTAVETFDRVMSVNARGVWLGMKHAIPALLDRGGGAIVNVGSYAAIRGSAGIAVYSASKHAVVGMTKSVALEFAKQNIRANVLSPGSMDTPMIRKMYPLHGNGDSVEGERVTLSRIPQGRLARPDELASVGVWLLMDAPEHLSGQVITVDGARSAG
jgi:NAD(P)-dependent dehydrogenase (short-subunit alcohol dehydrogenase family)